MPQTAQYDIMFRVLVIQLTVDLDDRYSAIITINKDIVGEELLQWLI